MTDEPEDHSKPGERGHGIDSRAEPTRALVIVPDTPAPRGERRGEPVRTSEQKLEEAVGLALAIDLDVVGTLAFNLGKPKAGTLIGTGRLAEMAEMVANTKAEVVIVDHTLTPVQQRNLEKELKAKVLDRTGLILEIFGRRARTKEGRLQVELAHLNYQRGRLVRSWTHLERQRGGAGFLGGPGETQIEADRRILRAKISGLESELESVRRTRQLHRAKRKKVPLPIVAFVGYTNAGKSTLFNRLTGAEVLAEDMLFATLDPTLRRVQLPGGTWIIVSDTVGFISDLPTHLVAAFRATLEEVQEANLVLHVRDASDPASSLQAADVRRVLKGLDVNPDDEQHVIDVYNKIDALEPDAREALKQRLEPPMGAERSQIALSALTGEGVDALLELIESRISGALKTETITIAPEEFALVAWLYQNAQVQARETGDDGSITMTVEITPENLEIFNRRAGRASAKPADDDY